MFANSLDEFDDSEEVVKNLIEEYKNAEKQDFIDWNLEDYDDNENL
jgi:hypothetical protein